MALDLSAEQRSVLAKGLREALLQVRDGKPGAMGRVEGMFDLALSDSKELLRLAESAAGDAEDRKH